MDGDAPRALSQDPTPTRLGALLALAWWGILAMLVWVCFLKAPPRGLAITGAWFATPRPTLLIAVTVLLLAGGALAVRPGPGRTLGIVSLVLGLLTALYWCLALLLR